jgi:hypothetical protein
MAANSPSKGKQPFYLKKFKILIFLLILIILVPGYFLIIKPEYESYQDNKRLSAQYQQEREVGIKQLKNYKQTVSVYQSVSSLQESRINQILPNDLEESNLYVNLEALVQQAGLILEDISIEAVDESKSPTKKTPDSDAAQPAVSNSSNLINIQLKLADVSYARMKDFLSILEVNLRLLDVDTFKFNAQEGNLGLAIKAYYFE